MLSVIVMEFTLNVTGKVIVRNHTFDVTDTT